MKQIILVIIILPLFMILGGLSFDTNIDYKDFVRIKTRNMKLKVNNKDVENINSILIFEEVEEGKIKNRNYFKDERYVVQKYNLERIYEGYGEYNDKIEINNNTIQSVDGFIIINEYSYREDPPKYMVMFGNDEDFVLLRYSSNIDIYDASTMEIKTIIELENEIPDKMVSISEYKLLFVKGEWFIVFGMYHDKDYIYRENESLHTCFRIYKYNILKKEVIIWDSDDYNLTTFIFDSYYLKYDISLNKRYIFMSFIDGGVYAYDWWEDKIYKIYQAPAFDEFKEMVGEKLDETGPIMADVVVDPEDGYMYIGVYNLFGLKRAHKYYRIKAREVEEVLSSYSEK